MKSPIESTGESLTPAKKRQSIDRWVEILDDLFRIPFTEIRFGVDVILGLVPVVGDFAGLLCGVPLLVEGVRRRLPLAVLLAMTLNVLVDAVIGSVPVLGNLFDIAWRAHRKNLRLVRDPASLSALLREARWKLGALIGIVALLALMLTVLLVFAVRLMLMARDWSWAL